MRKRVEVFCCYAHEDQKLLQELKKHLMPLDREGLITLWADIDMNAGAEWEQEIHLHLNTSHIILLLVSSDFMASDYCYSTEMQRAFERHEHDEARVIPIILRPVSWQKTPLSKLQALPKDANPITKWPNQDEAFNDVSEKLREVVEAILLKEEQCFPSMQEFAATLDQAARGRFDRSLHLEIDRKPPPFTGNQLPTSSGQEKEIEELDDDEKWAEAAWQRIKQNDVPATWHILKDSTGTILGQCGGALFLCMFLAGLFTITGIPGNLLTLVDSILSVSWHLSQPLSFISGSLILFAFFAVSAGLFSRTNHIRFVLLPDGFIAVHSSGGKLGFLLRYRDVEQMRFEGDKGILVVAMTSSSFLYEIPISKSDQSPHLLPQRIQEAYTRFQACNTTQRASARYEKQPEVLDLEVATFLVEIQEGTTTLLQYASAPPEKKKPAGVSQVNKNARKRWASIQLKGAIPATWYSVKRRNAHGFILMSDGLIDFQPTLYGCSCLLINYKDVKNIRLSTKKKLIVTWVSSSCTYELDISRTEDLPLIAHRVQKAYTSFRTRNALS